MLDRSLLHPQLKENIVLSYRMLTIASNSVIFVIIACQREAHDDLRFEYVASISPGEVGLSTGKRESTSPASILLSMGGAAQWNVLPFILVDIPCFNTAPSHTLAGIGMEVLNERVAFLSNYEVNCRKHTY